MTPFQLHVENWKDCTRCDLHLIRRHVVLVRGTGIPCDIVFIGEAPGHSENSGANKERKPFCGPAGILLDYIISESVPTDMTYAVTNLIGCIPKDDGGKLEEPPEEAIISCKPRVQELIELCNPKLIVTVGKHATEWCSPYIKGNIKFKPTKQVSILHPAYLLRQSEHIRQQLARKCIISISTVIEEINSPEYNPASTEYEIPF